MLGARIASEPSVTREISNKHAGSVGARRHRLETRGLRR
jgi:hypothetical protein